MDPFYRRSEQPKELPPHHTVGLAQTDTRERIRNMVRLGLFGTPRDPTKWPVIVDQIKRLYPGMVAGWAVIVLQEEYPDLYGAIVEQHGEFRPGARGGKPR